MNIKILGTGCSNCKRLEALVRCIMQHFATPQLCARRATDGHAAAGPCVVVFEAPDLPALATSVAEWVAAHPAYAILSLSHACEARLEDRASLGGPAHVPVYTGLLLVTTVVHDGFGTDASPEPPSYEADSSHVWRAARDLVASGR